MIDRRGKIILYAIGVLLALLVVIEFTRPRPLDWSYSYTSGDKIPFGAYVLFDQLPQIFPGQPVKSVDQVPMDFLRDNDSLTGANYIFINDYLYFDKVEAEYLMKFAARGNKVFIATNSAFGELADTLGMQNVTLTVYDTQEYDTIRTRLVNPRFKDRSYVYDRGTEYSYLEAYDTLTTTILGEVLPLEPSKGFIDRFLNKEPRGTKTNRR